jgi:hypothetical protein
VLVTTDGWVKRQCEIRDPGKTRLREGDQVLTCFAGSTRATAVFFSNFGYAVTSRAGRGRELLKNGTLTSVVRPEVPAPPLFEGQQETEETAS